MPLEFGLSIVLKILKMHDCKIEVESKVGEGTQFIVWIPVSQPYE